MIPVKRLRRERKRKELSVRCIKYSYLGTIVAGDLDEALVAIDNREVDDLSVR